MNRKSLEGRHHLVWWGVLLSEFLGNFGTALQLLKALTTMVTGFRITRSKIEILGDNMHILKTH